MTRTLTPTERETFLMQPHIAVMSVASDDDRPPLTVPIWYAYERGGNFTFFTGTQGRTARKTRLLQRSGTLSVCVQQPQFPYRYVTAECTVVKADQKPEASEVIAIVGRYLPEDAAQEFAEAEVGSTAGTFVLFTVRPDRWLSFDFGDAGD